MAKKHRKLLTGLALATSAAMLVGACSSSDSSGDSNTLEFWHNSTTGDGKAYWEEAVAAFEAANEGVTINIQSIQNEDMDGRLQTALNSGDGPDIFMSRGGGKLAAVVEAGQALDITDYITDATKAAIGEGGLSAFAIDGKYYGLPTSVLPGGIYYSKDLFQQAGITSTPTNFTELSAAVDALKGIGVAPIALGAKDAWPAAHWYYFFALRECSQDVFSDIGNSMDFSDPCWTAAGESLAEFAATEPFNDGFLTTSAQQGAGSSAGLLANHQAAMELMGAWNPGVIAGLTPDGQPLADLGWFPFPAVDGGNGDPTALMGGADGYTCNASAPAQLCADFLNFIAQKEWQEKYADAFVTLPASQEAQGVVADPALQDILTAYNDAAYVSVWLDTLLGQNVGNALNVGVVNLLAGQGDVAGIISGVEAAAAQE